MPSFNDISKAIEKALKRFDKSIPGLQSELYKEMLVQIKRLDTDGTRIKVTVKNLSILASIKNKLSRIILNKDYLTEVKDFAKVFNEVFRLQTEYWKSVEKKFEPKALLKAIRNQAITDTVKSLTHTGIGQVTDQITGILRTNITAGGSYADLADQLRESLVNTESKGILDRYVKTITIDSINQFNRRYTNIVASDLGYEWYRYQNTLIDTSRPFCQSMIENNSWFHVSQIPELLQGRYLGQRMTYQDNFGGGQKTVDIYKKTGLPYGMIEGTNEANFFDLAGGHSCGHSIQPVAERQVPQDVKEAIFNTMAYRAWMGMKTEPIKGPQIEESHSFINDRGNKVVQYKLTEGLGGYVRVEHYKDGFSIPNIILDPQARGKGLATDFYKKINQESVKATGKTLQSIKRDSDGKVELSSDGQRLWKSLVKKGLAKEIGSNRYRFI